ncbi:MAG: hypothetical protein LBQ20_11480 [Rhodanobacter sp.]|jgi:hypothetical protein|nr:hypothetical protein [Rhodanobacter sp.]
MQDSVAVAVIVFSAFALLCMVAIWKYSATDARSTILSLAGIFGALFGGLVTYFLTRPEVIAAHAEADRYRTQVDKMSTEVKDMRDETDLYRNKLGAARTEADQYKMKFDNLTANVIDANKKFIDTIKSKPTVTLGDLRIDPRYKDVLSAFDTAVTRSGQPMIEWDKAEGKTDTEQKKTDTDPKKM